MGKWVGGWVGGREAFLPSLPFRRMTITSPTAACSEGERGCWAFMLASTSSWREARAASMAVGEGRG